MNLDLHAQEDIYLLTEQVETPVLNENQMVEQNYMLDIGAEDQDHSLIQEVQSVEQEFDVGVL